MEENKRELVTKINMNFNLIKESYKQKFIQAQNLDDIRKAIKVIRN
jgi:hypothetical protein